MKTATIEIGDREVDGILADAHTLAVPRYPGTPGDDRAMEHVARRFGEAGLEVRVEEFTYDVRPAFRALRTALAGTAVLLLASGFLAPSTPLGAAALLAVGLGAGGFVLGWSPWSERLYRGEGPTRTANIAGHRPAVGAPRVTVILLAHHDSKSQNLTLPWRLGMTLLALAGGLVLTVAVVAGFLLGGLPGPGWLAPASGSVAAGALLVLSTLSSGNRSPGGVDNAGSLAIVLHLAALLPPASPDDVEWIFLSPGAEEDHMVGAMRWLDAHRRELGGRPVWAINLDGAGNPGKVALLERFGFGRTFSRPLSNLARRCAAELGIPVRGVYLPPAMGVDAIPFAHRDVDCLTLASGSLNRATLAIHSANDRAENLDRETLRRATRLAAAMALELAARPSARA